MKFRSIYGFPSLGASLASLGMAFAGSLAGFGSQASGEVVYDSEAQVQAGTEPAAPAPRADDRETLRQVMGASQRGRTASQGRSIELGSVTTTAIPATAPMAATQVQVSVEPRPALVQSQPQAAVAQADTADSAMLSKSELIRRERLREELKNEDVLQERLEELRLRDERHRTEQLLAGSPGTADPGAAAAQTAPVQSTPVYQESVAAPVTERPGQPATQAQVIVQPVSAVTPPQASHAPASTSDSAMQDQVTVAHVSTNANPEDKTSVFVVPRAGLANMTSADALTVAGRYSVGASLGVGASENLVFEVGYSFNEYGISVNNQYNFAYPYQSYNPSGQYETLAMKQNVYDLGLKFYLLNSDSKIRPFVGGGAGYSKSYVNYDQRILSQMTQFGYNPNAQDYEIESWLGEISTGIDVKINKNITVGAEFKYYSVLSARENDRLPYSAFYQPGAYVPPTAGLSNPYSSDYDKQVAGGSLARSSFYSIQAGVSFSL